MLISKYIDEFDASLPLSEYPRPQLRRESYLSLNGKWDFALSPNKRIIRNFESQIIVPYCMESMLSHIGQKKKTGDYLIYHKKVILPKGFVKDHLLLHFDGVDQICDIYINQIHIKRNEFGYLPFEMDILPYIKGNEFDIDVIVEDETSPLYPFGKQKIERGGMWYTCISGIWKSVWLESVYEDYIQKLTITPNIDENCVDIVLISTAKEFEIKIFDGENLIHREKSSVPYFHIVLENMKLWSPENPFLYHFEISCKKDHIQSYFAMRKFETSKHYFMLNHQPYFIHGLLDQGYFPDGIYTPPTMKAYQEDILKMKEMGFNCIRKHLKIEPLYFYYLCDILGILVFQDIVNNGPISFIKDTILPTLGFKNKPKSKEQIHIDFKKYYKESLISTINLLYNQPSVVYYTLFNEGWGQHQEDEYYQLVKEIDATRVVDSTSGWFKGKYSDVESLHIYFKNANLKNTESEFPIILSEFGGFSFKIEGHIESQSVYGYKNFSRVDSFNKAILNLYQKSVIENIKYHLAGCIYTQYNDIEDEINGLITYDRKVLKVDLEMMKNIKKRIDEEFNHERI